MDEKLTHMVFVNGAIYVLNNSILYDVCGISYLDKPQMLESKVENAINMFSIREYWMDVEWMI
jgi:hypothetical protein|tara:strand:+ start:87 stop:275 length:189 start_codon:yes stop_codon:yes gene_type:complete